MQIQGYVADGYEVIREEFARNLDKRGELGGAFSATVDGEVVVDIWGGWADPGNKRPWRDDTEVVIFSATKGVAAMALAHLHSRDLLDYDRPVAEYWPEFATEGKESITVRQLISHQAGLVLPSRPLDQQDPEACDAALSETKPLWEPGTRHGYHAGTVGFAISALVRRIDPMGRNVDRYVREELAHPLGVDFHIGLPEKYDRSRLAELKLFNPMEALFHLGSIPSGLRKVLFNPKSLFWKSMGESGPGPNDPAFTRGENPSGNGVCTARDLAVLYGAFANGGSAKGGRIELSSKTLDLLFGPPEEPQEGILDQVMNLDARYGLGFQKSTTDPAWFSDNPNAIGFLGASGAFAWADRDLGIGAAYVTNRMSPGTQINDPREKALREALLGVVRDRKGAYTRQ